ncbi:MAG: hypothetical protein VXW22_15135 [Pseudomonadota bacterium]|nr:hypothetical protein [Pseudomonadota bacterium]
MSKMDDMLSGLRRIVTADDGDGKSHIMIDGGPAAEFRTGDIGGLLEIWHDDVSGPLDPGPCPDKGAGTPVLSPDKGKVKIRWFTSGPTPEGAPPEMIAELTRQAEGVRKLISAKKVAVSASELDTLLAAADMSP